MYRFALYLLISLLVAGCTSDSESKEALQSFERQNIPLDQKLKKAVDSEYLTSIGVPEQAHGFVKKYYSQRKYAARWCSKTTLTQEGKNLKKIFQNKLAIGIPKTRFSYKKTSNFIQDEIWLTVATAFTVNDLQLGIVDYTEKVKRPLKCVSASTFDQLVKFNNTEDLRLQFAQFGPKDTAYHVLCEGLIELLDRLPLDTTTFEVKSIRNDTTLAIEKTRLALISKGYFKKNTGDTLGLTEALQVFQVDNGLKPDGVIGKYTAQALNESTYHKVERVLLALDKMRSDRVYPAKYIRINIPEYKLRYFINDSLKSDHNIVVGKYENQTPQLESTLRRIIVFPYWNVPYSISSKEILPALQVNSGYLAKHDYKIYRKDVEIDPATVNWKSIRQNSFPYKVVQGPGKRNSLGVIKFDFSNTHSVYFHDTPSKGLFGADVRAYSHGCMRTQFPISLAKVILERDSIPYKGNPIKPDTLDSILARSVDFNYPIRLIEPIAIYIDYVSVVRNQQRMVIHLDIYGRDEEYLKILC